MRRAGLQPGARVLVRVPSWLGDAVAAEPALRALLERVGEVSAAGPERLVRLLAETHVGLRPLPADDAASWRGHDVCVLLTNSFRSAWAAWRAGIPERVGWDRDARGWLLTRAARPAREAGRRPLGIGRRGAWPRFLPRPFASSCAELVGLVGVAVPDARPRLEPTAGARRTARSRLEALGLADGAGYVLANVGGRPGSAKAFPAPSWIPGLAAVRDGCGLPVVLVSGPDEAARADEVAAGSGPGVYALTPPPELSELLALCAGARVLLTADSGPRHLAVAAGTPVAVVCGPTDPRHTADHLERTRVVREPVECGPCHRERCPLAGGERDACMRRIDPGELARAALALLR